MPMRKPAVAAHSSTTSRTSKSGRTARSPGAINGAVQKRTVAQRRQLAAIAAFCISNIHFTDEPLAPPCNPSPSDAPGRNDSDQSKTPVSPGNCCGPAEHIADQEHTRDLQESLPGQGRHLEKQPATPDGDVEAVSPPAAGRERVLHVRRFSGCGSGSEGDPSASWSSFKGVPVLDVSIKTGESTQDKEDGAVPPPSTVKTSATENAEIASTPAAGGTTWLTRIFSIANKAPPADTKQQQSTALRKYLWSDTATAEHPSVAVPEMQPLLGPLLSPSSDCSTVHEQPVVIPNPEKLCPPTTFTEPAEVPATEMSDTGKEEGKLQLHIPLDATSGEHDAGPPVPDLAPPDVPSLEESLSPAKPKQTQPESCEDVTPFKAHRFGGVTIPSLGFMKNRRSMETDTGATVTTRRSGSGSLVPRLNLPKSAAPDTCTKGEADVSASRSGRLPPLSGRDSTAPSASKAGPAVPRLQLGLSISRVQYSEPSPVDGVVDADDDLDSNDQSDLDLPVTTTQPASCRSRGMLSSTPRKIPTPRSSRMIPADPYSPKAASSAGRTPKEASQFDVIPQGFNLSRQNSFTSTPRGDDATWRDQWFPRGSSGVQASSGSITGCALRDRMLREQLMNKNTAVKSPPNAQQSTPRGSSNPVLNVYADSASTGKKGLFSFLSRSSSNAGHKAEESGIIAGALQRIGSAFTASIKEGRDNMLQDMQRNDRQLSMTSRVNSKQ